MITCDTSVLVAASAEWHGSHARAVAAMRRVDALVDHVVIETFSVLTRMRPPLRVPARVVAAFLDAHFDDSVPRLPSASSQDLVETALHAGITGGAVYDLVVALAAGKGGATLLSLDRRAVPTYDGAGVAYELVG